MHLIGSIKASIIAFLSILINLRFLFNSNKFFFKGTRHPFLFKYKVAYDDDGKIQGCDLKAYNNAGYSFDLSFSVLDRATFHFQNAYKIPNVRVEGNCLRTHLPSNTAFRGFGGPQGMMVGEHIVRDIAAALGKDYLEVMRVNLFQDGDRTPYNQLLSNCTNIRCFEEVQSNSEFQNRKAQVEKFNQENRWKKRGISLVNTMFGIAFTAPHLNQTGALVHVYVDGSVLISHGGKFFCQLEYFYLKKFSARCRNGSRPAH